MREPIRWGCSWQTEAGADCAFVEGSQDLIVRGSQPTGVVEAKSVAAEVGRRGRAAAADDAEWILRILLSTILHHKNWSIICLRWTKILT
jgi:hypothetical protein